MRGHHRQAQPRGELDGGDDVRLVVGSAGALQLDVEAVGEQRRQLAREVVGARRVALQQRRGSPSSRSTVGTVTTLSNSMRMLYSRAGTYPAGSDLRLEILNDKEGVWRCRTTFNCSEACPRGIQVTQAIAEVKQAMISGKVS